MNKIPDTCAIFSFVIISIYSNHWFFFQCLNRNIFKKIKKNCRVVYEKRRAGDVDQVYSNINKFKKTFKWKPKHNNIKKILLSSIKWERKLSKNNVKK